MNSFNINIVEDVELIGRCRDKDIESSLHPWRFLLSPKAEMKGDKEEVIETLQEDKDEKADSAGRQHLSSSPHYIYLISHDKPGLIYPTIYLFNFHVLIFKYICI